MLAATDPTAVRLCLDSHWIFRGCENSAAAVADAVRLYGARTVELHLRNSAGGVWTESFGPGDLDYAAIRTQLEALGVTDFGRPGGPLLVLEQSVEDATPTTMTAAEAHARGAGVRGAGVRIRDRSKSDGSSDRQGAGRSASCAPGPKATRAAPVRKRSDFPTGSAGALPDGRGSR